TVAGVSGELKVGAVFESSGTAANGNVTLTPTTGAGATAMLAYYNQTQFYSGVEVSSVASGFGTLSLMKSGGTVTIGTAQLTIAAGTGLITAYNNVATAG